MIPLFHCLHIFMSQIVALRLIDIGFSNVELGMFDSYMIFGDLIVIFLIGRLDFEDKLFEYYNMSNTVLVVSVSRPINTSMPFSEL